MRALLGSILAVLVLQAGTKPQRFVLPNGLTVLLLETHEHPLVRARLHLPLGPSERPLACPLLPEQFLRLLDRADRGGRTGSESDRDREAQGIQLHSSAEPSGLEWRLLARSRDQDRALGLLGDLLLRAIPDPADWSKTCDLPWKEVQTFQQRVLRPGQALLVLQGDLGLEQAKRLVFLSMGTWSTSGPSDPKPSPAPVSPEAQALRTLLAPPGEPRRSYGQDDLDRARRAWLGRQLLLSLDPEAQMTQVLQEALGRAPQEERMRTLTVEELNR